MAKLNTLNNIKKEIEKERSGVPDPLKSDEKSPESNTKETSGNASRLNWSAEINPAIIKRPDIRLTKRECFPKIPLFS